MAFPHAFATYTVQDSKGATSVMQIKFPSASDVPTLADFVATTALMINNFIRGRIISAGIGIGVDISSVGIRPAPLAGSDVEEGGRFSWSTASNTNPDFRVPTIDEAFLVEGSREVDVADPVVDTFVQRIIQGRTIGLTNVSPSDDHGLDIISLATAKESFQSSRKG